LVVNQEVLDPLGFFDADDREAAATVGQLSFDGGNRLSSCSDLLSDARPSGLRELGIA
jgi:hypothetical protein